jgi:asparagine synthase (glutamine-hydrolysing)
MIDSTEQTLVAGVKRLLPSHYMEFPLSPMATATAKRYWTLDITSRLELGFKKSAERLRDLFRESVSLHLRSDVPLATALSGGIDSSAVVSTVRDLSGPELQLHTFSYIAEDQRISEERWVDVMAAHTQSIVHKVRPTASEFFDDLDQYLYANDEPTGAFNGYAQYRVFRLEKESGVKVSLDGQGADEQLCGYSCFQEARLRTLLRSGQIGRAWRLSKGMDLSSDAKSFYRFGRKALKAFGADSWRRRLSGGSLNGNGTTTSLLNTAWFQQHGVDVTHANTNGHAQGMREMLAETFWGSSLPRLLRCADRNSMAHSIECRVPFLTPDLVQFCFSLPDEYLVDADGLRKSVFRTAMSGTVPGCILRRSDKIALDTPDWLDQCRNRVAGLLNGDDLRRVKAVSAPAALGIAANTSRDPAHNNRLWWRALCLVRWSRVFDIAY